MLLTVKSGQVYKHYKGCLYKVIDIATHSETLEPLVLYCRADMNDSRIWARPYKMWHEIVMVNSNENIKARRFTLVEDVKWQWKN